MGQQGTQKTRSLLHRFTRMASFRCQAEPTWVDLSAMATENWLPSEMTEFDSFELEQNGTEMRGFSKDMQRDGQRITHTNLFR